MDEINIQWELGHKTHAARAKVSRFEIQFDGHKAELTDGLRSMLMSGEKITALRGFHFSLQRLFTLEEARTKLEPR